MNKTVQQKNIDELVKLQKENPNAKVMCFVSSECINDDYGYTSANFGKPRLEKMALWGDVWTNDEDDIKMILLIIYI